VEAWEFGRTVRRWRDRVAPETVGVPVGRRRRATGLRREELAALAGISADYLTRLEQGRAIAPSAQVVEALARALRLSDTERDLLYQLAGHAAPGPGIVSSRLTPSVQRLLDRLAHTPVVVYDATWTLVLANAPYDALMGARSSSPSTTSASPSIPPNRAPRTPNASRSPSFSARRPSSPSRQP
jgi:transcriptional regulator with XRE-family HTH domain